MKKSAPAITRLIAEGFFDSRESALPYILMGAVYVGSEQVKSGGQLVPNDKPLTVRGLYDRYVSKGGYKLEGAIKDFGIDVGGRVCIDAGACTGGFTDCLIKHGAQQAYAVEVGFGQLAGSLVQNPRVINMEKTNIGDERLLALDPKPTLGSVDLSYLSLRKAVPQFRAVMDGRGELICLVKPLFETDDALARRTGNIDESTFPKLLRSLIDELDAQAGTRVTGVTNSPVTGNNGTREFFLHVRFEPRGEKKVSDADIALAVERAMLISPFKK